MSFQISSFLDSKFVSFLKVGLQSILRFLIVAIFHRNMLFFFPLNFRNIISQIYHPIFEHPVVSTYQQKNHYKTLVKEDFNFCKSKY